MEGAQSPWAAWRRRDRGFGFGGRKRCCQQSQKHLFHYALSIVAKRRPVGKLSLRICYDAVWQLRSAQEHAARSRYHRLDESTNGLKRIKIASYRKPFLS